MERRTSTIEIVFFITLLATALAMGAALAHALELPNKMALARDEYFVVQKIYRGWDRLGYLLGVELIGLLSLMIMLWHDKDARNRVFAALVFLAAAQAAFWIYTFPSNQLTSDWTVQPENWEDLRRQWEYSHLAGALAQTLALAALLSAFLIRR